MSTAISLLVTLACLSPERSPVPSLAQPAAAPSAPAAPSAAPAVTPLAHVEARGSGPVTLILVPGLACDWTVYEAFMTRNKDRYTMLAVTLPGFGQSQPPPAGVDDKASAGAWLGNAENALLNLIAERKLVKPYVVGHSMGAHLALRLAAHHSERLAGAVAIDGFPAFPMSINKPLTKAERAKQVDEMVVPQMKSITDEQWAVQMRSGLQQWVTDPARGKALGELFAAVPRTTSVRYITELFAADVTDELANASVPVLGIVAFDPTTNMVPQEMYVNSLMAMFAPAKQNQVVLFEDTRHFVMDDAPAELDAAVADFVAGKPVKGKAGKPRPEVPKAVPVDPPASGEAPKSGEPFAKPKPQNQPEKPR